jgi:hypothetical protein
MGGRMDRWMDECAAWDLVEGGGSIAFCRSLVECRPAQGRRAGRGSLPGEALVPPQDHIMFSPATIRTLYFLNRR